MCNEGTSNPHNPEDKKSYQLLPWQPYFLFCTNVTDLGHLEIEVSSVNCLPIFTYKDGNKALSLPWHCVTGWVVPDTLKAGSAFIFRLKQTGHWRWTTAFEMLPLTHPMTQCHIQDVILQQTCCENHLQLVHIIMIGNNCNFCGSLNFTTTTMVQAVSCWSPTVQAQSTWDLWYIMWQWDRCSLSTSVFSSRYHSKDALYSFFHLPLMW